MTVSMSPVLAEQSIHGTSSELFKSAACMPQLDNLCLGAKCQCADCLISLTLEHIPGGSQVFHQFRDILLMFLAVNVSLAQMMYVNLIGSVRNQIFVQLLKRIAEVLRMVFKMCFIRWLMEKL